MANKDMFLWWGSGSAPCWRAMLVLAEKGLWEGLPNKLISFSEKGHKQDDIMKLNPRGQVPTFKDGDFVVNESGAICLYLIEKYSTQGTQLMPTDTAARAQVFQRMFEAENIRSNIIAPIVMYKFRTKEADWDKELLKEKSVKATEEVETWAKYLSENDYLVGDSFTLADVFFFPFLAFMVRVGLDLSSRPGLKKYYDRVLSRPSVGPTWPPHWKEDEGKKILGEL